MLRYALFDLDDTLYPSRTGLWAAIGERISLYMVERLHLKREIVSALREHYFGSFGSTLNGLIRDFKVDAADYLAFVHDLPLDEYLQPDPELERMLARLPLTHVIFTNADAAHAGRVLARLGVSHHFKQIVDIYALGFVNKPDAGSYARVLDLTGAQAHECVFADDTQRNLLPARVLGMLTVLVGGRAVAGRLDGVDHHIPTILDLERVLAGRLGH